jgi:hypothetical protein
VAGQCINCPTIIYTSRARIANDLPIVLDRNRRIEEAKEEQLRRIHAARLHAQLQGNIHGLHWRGEQVEEDRRKHRS